MPDRKRLLAGNWKMNGLRADGLALARELAERAKAARLGCELLVCPPATLLVLVAEALQGSGIALGGQDCHAAPKGAFTGSISAEMLRDVGCTHAIVGHSGRRRSRPRMAAWSRWSWAANPARSGKGAAPSTWSAIRSPARCRRAQPPKT